MKESYLSLAPEYIGNIFGPCDENKIAIEKTYGVSIVNRNDDVKLSGDDEAVDAAFRLLRDLEEIARKGETVSTQHITYLANLPAEEQGADIKELLKDTCCITKAGKPVRPKTFGQKQYVNAIRRNMLTFGIGPAGTGKTYLAMAMAVTALKNGEVERIILTRPAIEAGERLGFLPGDLQQKIDPYLRPLYDALFEMLGPDAVARNQEKGVIEVAPLAYMRGRTLDNSFIVLDEAQNTTQAQMKMFLTRIGFGSKVVVTGDTTQIDLPDGQKSGLKHAVAILKDVEDIGIVHLTNRDVVRHQLVQRIVEAYDKAEKGELNRPNEYYHGGKK